MPFANAQPDDFDWNTRQPLKLHPSAAPAMTAEIESCLLYQGDPHFMRVDVTLVDGRSCLEVAILDADGVPLEHGVSVPQWLTRSALGRWKLGISSCPAVAAAHPSAAAVPAPR
jgi:hypothetical protein